MAWRDVLDGVASSIWIGTADKGDIAARLLAMPIPDRIALMRELAPGTGLVVAKDVGELPAASVQGSVAVVETWNACRAAMLECGK